MDYSIKAIETVYKGFTFRSRLEAKWAAMFDLLGWDWDYEPVDFNGWFPDFAIYGKVPIYVEVKPVVSFPFDVAKKMVRSGCRETMLIVGQACLLPSMNDLKDRPDFRYPFSHIAFGWMTLPWVVVPWDHPDPNDAKDEWERNFYTEQNESGWRMETNDNWSHAIFGRWNVAKGSIGFCHRPYMHTDWISGGYDGRHRGGKNITAAEIKNMWAKAHHLTQWHKKTVE